MIWNERAEEHIHTNLSSESAGLFLHDVLALRNSNVDTSGSRHERRLILRLSSKVVTNLSVEAG
jgi:hypothetical protein